MEPACVARYLLAYRLLQLILAAKTQTQCSKQDVVYTLAQYFRRKLLLVAGIVPDELLSLRHAPRPLPRHVKQYFTIGRHIGQISAERLDGRCRLTITFGVAQRGSDSSAQEALPSGIKRTATVVLLRPSFLVRAAMSAARQLLGFAHAYLHQDSVSSWPAAAAAIELPPSLLVAAPGPVSPPGVAQPQHTRAAVSSAATSNKLRTSPVCPSAAAVHTPSASSAYPSGSHTEGPAASHNHNNRAALLSAITSFSRTQQQPQQPPQQQPDTIQKQSKAQSQLPFSPAALAAAKGSLVKSSNHSSNSSSGSNRRRSNSAPSRPAAVGLLLSPLPPRHPALLSPIARRMMTSNDDQEEEEEEEEDNGSWSPPSTATAKASGHKQQHGATASATAATPHRTPAAAPPQDARSALVASLQARRRRLTVSQRGRIRTPTVTTTITSTTAIATAATAMPSISSPRSARTGSSKAGSAVRSKARRRPRDSVFGGGANSDDSDDEEEEEQAHAGGTDGEDDSSMRDPVTATPAAASAGISNNVSHTSALATAASAAPIPASTALTPASVASSTSSFSSPDSPVARPAPFAFVTPRSRAVGGGGRGGPGGGRSRLPSLTLSANSQQENQEDEQDNGVLQSPELLGSPALRAPPFSPRVVTTARQPPQPQPQGLLTPARSPLPVLPGLPLRQLAPGQIPQPRAPAAALTGAGMKSPRAAAPSGQRVSAAPAVAALFTKRAGL